MTKIIQHLSFKYQEGGTLSSISHFFLMFDRLNLTIRVGSATTNLTKKIK